MRLVLLGNPVAHSRSPAIHSAALAHLGIAGEYLARRVDAGGVADAVGELRSGALDGANVTMPHKRLAARLCDRLDADAAAGRATNTLAIRDGELCGWNTDVAALRSVASGRPGERTVLVLGAGGAAAAALVAFSADRVWVAARRPDAAARHARQLCPSARAVAWGMAVPGALVVNATPIGMRGERLPEAVLAAAGGLIDLPYAAEATPACAAARRLGINCVDGIDLLVAQAAESFRIWTGVEAPVEVMREAARA